jgi:hypothetical protein
MIRVVQAKQDYNKELATLLGWTEIVELGGSLLGRPIDGAPASRGQAKIPDWAGNWADCGKLIEKMGYLSIHLSLTPEIIMDFWNTKLNHVHGVCPLPDLQRMYIVDQYIAQLKKTAT